MSKKRIASPKAVMEIINILANLKDGTDQFKVMSAVCVLSGKFYVEESA